MKDLNYRTLLIFAPLLILTGLLGFVLPAAGPLSGAPAYNVFHIVSGLIGLLCLVSRRRKPVRSFNIGFGLIDLYQALASFSGWFPAGHFQWKPADDVLHIVIGAALVLIGLLGSDE